MGRRAIVLASVVAAIAVAATLAVLLTRSNGSPNAPVAVRGATTVAALLDGIPQHGTALGKEGAPVTLFEFADLQCPYCGIWARDSLPTIVARYVRPGKVRLVFEGMAFVGTDSLTALRTALAAGRQSRFWNVLELLYENQGAENSGWVTDPLLRGVGGAVTGLDTARMLDERSSAAVDRALANASAVARNAGVTSTPSFAVGRTGGSMRLLHLTSLDSAELSQALDAALSS